MAINYKLSIAVATAIVLAANIGNAWAIDPAPSTAFVQGGVGDQKTTAYVAGLTWDLPWHYQFGVGRFGAYVEAAFGRWRTDTSRGKATSWPTQISAVPSLRFCPGHSVWFAEIGAGPSYIVPLFNSGTKRFSTEFNFDDHFSIGRDFGHFEVSLRAEHFSNAGISRSNPGENFGQVRVAYRF